MTYIKTAIRWGLTQVILWAGMWVFLLNPVQGAEVIKSYSSNIELLLNGSVDVTETIVVNAEGSAIKRGIFRDIPTTLRNDDGSIVNSSLNVISVQKDGQAEPFRTTDITGGTRIYVGSSDVFLPNATYTYTIRYTMTRMARYFDEHDELYWNATGNFWSFPIEAAVAQVTLPEGAVISDISAYTGAQGSTESAVKTRATSDNVALFRATRALAPREGMSVSVSFQKGILTPPSDAEKALNFFSDHLKDILPLFAVFIVGLYFYFAWNAVGRDPEKGTIIPLFRAPEGYSPALPHFIDNMGWKKDGWTAYSAAIISLATRGMIEIEKDDKKKVTFTHIAKNNSGLPRGEAVIESYLGKKQKLKITKSTGPQLAVNKKKFTKAISEENRNAYFHNNWAYSVFGIFLAAGSILGLVAFGVFPPGQGVALLMAGAGLGFLALFWGSLVNGTWGSRIVTIMFISIFGVNMLSSFTPLLASISIDTPFVSALSIVVISAVFLYLMRAPTVHGRKIMDQIDGFKMYLKTAEENRLNFSQEPDFTVKRFEEILPYAIALGVEKPWAQRLEGEFARNAIEEARGGYHPHWYHGSGFNSRDLGSSVSGIASSMSSAMISSQPSSSSSSGGGGGGSSGGGGGGGGGGGW